MVEPVVYYARRPLSMEAIDSTAVRGYYSPMHCLKDAYDALLCHYRINPIGSESAYQVAKRSLQRFDRPTAAAIAPYIVALMAEFDGLLLQAQHTLWTPEYFLSLKGPEHIKTAVTHSGVSFGPRVKRVSLQPAVYCCVGTRHAFFSVELPERSDIAYAFTVSRPKQGGLDDRFKYAGASVPEYTGGDRRGDAHPAVG